MSKKQASSLPSPRRRTADTTTRVAADGVGSQDLRRAGTKSNRSKPAVSQKESDLRLLLGIARMSGGDHRLARALTKGGYPDWDSAMTAVIRASNRFVLAEGALVIDTIILRNRRRSWAITEDDGRFFALANSWPTREPSATSKTDPAKVALELRERRELVRPVLSYLKKKKFRSRGNRQVSLEKEEQLRVAVQRLKSSDLLDCVLVDWKELPTAQVLASELLSKEHPEAGKASTIRGNVNRRRLRKRVIDFG